LIKKKPNIYANDEKATLGISKFMRILKINGDGRMAEN